MTQLILILYFDMAFCGKCNWRLPCIWHVKQIKIRLFTTWKILSYHKQCLIINFCFDFQYLKKQNLIVNNDEQSLLDLFLHRFLLGWYTPSCQRTEVAEAIFHEFQSMSASNTKPIERSKSIDKYQISQHLDSSSADYYEVFSHPCV